MAQKIICPQCKTNISIDDVLTHQIETDIRSQLETSMKAREQELSVRQQKLEAAREDLKAIVAKRVEENLQNEKIKLQAAIEKEKADEMKLLADQLREKEQKLDEARKTELDLRKAKIQLEEDKKAFELEKQRQLDEERSKIFDEAAKKAAGEQQFKMMELTKKLNDALVMNEELNRKLMQGSQQTQGEVLELELESILKREFPQDEIIPVGKGVNGADIVQKVHDKYGRTCGTIVWESKHTKNWTEGWIQKLKDDQLKEKADIAIIVSTVLPKEVTSFSFREGVWVSSFANVTGLATAVRIQLLKLQSIKLASVGKNEKMEILYDYLTGSEFKQKIEAIVTTFTSLQTDLDQEKRAFMRIWEKREKQITRVIENTIGMYGDLEGLTGQALPKIELLELPE